MAGLIRWRDLQNIFVTEDQINLLAGLNIDATLLNLLSGFTGSGAGLNTAITSVGTLNTHLAKDLATAHPLLPNSIDGGVIAGGTIAKNKLAFNALTDADQLVINNSIAALANLNNDLTIQVNNLYGVAFPSLTGNIAESFESLFSHIEQAADAHDATAVSFGNDYPLSIDALVGAIQVTIPASAIEYFKTGDTVEFKDSNSGPETRVLIGVDYNGNQIGWTTPLLQDYRVTNSAIVKNISGADVQTVIQRSLRNSTDSFSGRLSITQSSTDDALVINKTNTGYTTRFNDFIAKSDLGYSLELGSSIGNKFNVKDDAKRISFEVDDSGNGFLSTLKLEDRTALFSGLITKQALTADRTWTLPNRSGYIGVGDLTFTEVLKVRLVTGTKQLSIAPGFIQDYDNSTVSAWVSMDRPSAYPGTTFDIQARLISDNQILTLGNKWQVFTVYITDTDTVSLFYGPQRVAKVDAVTDYLNFIPSAYMKLAKLIVQGDGLGGILQSSIEILEDQRPFLTMGLSASYYEEVTTSASVISAGTLVTLPPNSRAGGLSQTYRVGKGQLEVYLDGTYQDVGVDYEENVGEPVGKIRVLKDIAANSKLKFRITFTAAAVSGGVDTPTMQSTYFAGNTVSMSSLYGPITLGSFDIDTLMNISGSISVSNKIYNLKSLMFALQSSLIGDLDVNQIFVNSDAELVFHQYKSGVATDFNIIQGLDEAKTLTRMPMFNASGVVVPKGRGIALHPALANSFVLCDTSNSLSTSRCIGVTLENFGIGETKDVVIGGLLKSSGLGLPHNSIVVVDPRNPGLLVNKTSVNFLPTDEYQEVGVVDGGNLIVDLLSIPKTKSVWKTGIAGEAFAANETRLVRFAVDGETRGRIYKASKSNANLDQKFWVIGAVQPTTAIAIGDSVNIYREIDLHVSETAFDDLDVGKPLFLDNLAGFKSWRLLNGAFTVGDAAIKIGMIEDRRKFIVDSIQMMGTAPGPSFN